MIDFIFLSCILAVSIPIISGFFAYKIISTDDWVKNGNTHTKDRKRKC